MMLLSKVNIHPQHLIFWVSSRYMFVFLQKNINKIKTLSRVSFRNLVDFTRNDPDIHSTQRVQCSGECSNVMTRVRVSLRRSFGSDPREVQVKLLEKWVANLNVTVRDSLTFPLSNPLTKRKKGSWAWHHQNCKSTSCNVQI